MNPSSATARRWLWISGVLVLLLVVLVFILRDDRAMRDAVEQLRVGMTVPEVREVLRPVREGHIWPIRTNSGEAQILFYGNDEFVTVVFDKEDGRVIRIERLADDGFSWDHLRRRCEHGFRRFVRWR
jgi:hypothetical protein